MILSIKNWSKWLREEMASRKASLMKNRIETDTGELVEYT